MLTGAYGGELCLTRWFVGFFGRANIHTKYFMNWSDLEGKVGHAEPITDVSNFGEFY